MKFNPVFAANLAALALLTGCGGGGNNAVTTVPTAHLQVVPNVMTAETGAPLTVTVSALDASNAVVTTYAGTVRITTSDASATLPADAMLPHGTSTFLVTFGTPGTHTITASDTAGNAIAATSGNVTVSLGVSSGTGEVGILPKSLMLPAGGVRQFGAWGTGSPVFVWSVAEGASGGSITADGLYTAPATSGTYHVILADASSTSTDIAAVTVTDAGIASTPTGSMGSARGAFTATLLANGPAASNGKVLVAGGNRAVTYYVDPARGLDSAELFDPSTGTFAATASMTTPRYAHTATLLPNGKVLLVGGLGDGGGGGAGAVLPSPPPLASAELYDPATGTFAATGSMHVARASHTATLISGGRVLIVGGTPDGGKDTGRYPYFGSGVLESAEIYDIATGVFTTTGSMTTKRLGHTATLLADGTVLVAGGVTTTDWLSGQGRWTATAELYDPTSGQFTVVGAMHIARELHAATLLSNGKVLITGGNWGEERAELYDPGTRTFSDTGSMLSARNAHTATQLPDGKILVGGGALQVECVEDFPASCDPVSSMEIFDPATGTFAPLGFMNTVRWAHAAALLDSGSVLLVGGEGEATAELYP